MLVEDDATIARSLEQSLRAQGYTVVLAADGQSALVLDARLKSKQKYWDRPGGAEAILQLRAAVLSEDDRLARFFAQRPGNPYRRRKAA